MPDLFDAFSTEFAPDPDMDEVDFQEEVQRYCLRQQAISALLDGNLDPDTVGDMLLEGGIEPLQWAIAVEENLQIILM